MQIAASRVGDGIAEIKGDDHAAAASHGRAACLHGLIMTFAVITGVMLRRKLHGLMLMLGHVGMVHSHMLMADHGTTLIHIRHVHGGMAAGHGRQTE